MKPLARTQATAYRVVNNTIYVQVPQKDKHPLQN